MEKGRRIGSFLTMRKRETMEWRGKKADTMMSWREERTTNITVYPNYTTDNNRSGEWIEWNAFSQVVLSLSLPTHTAYNRHNRHYQRDRRMREGREKKAQNIFLIHTHERKSLVFPLQLPDFQSPLFSLPPPSSLHSSLAGFSSEWSSSTERWWWWS